MSPRLRRSARRPARVVTIATRLRRARQERGLTIRDVASGSGLTESLGR